VLVPVVIALLALSLTAAFAVVWFGRLRTGTIDDPRLARVASADAERTRSAAYFCAHLPMDNPRASHPRG
jgi:hypothetical protein